jgi:hypothetical protein
LEHAFLWEYSYERLESAQVLGRHGVSLSHFAQRLELDEARRLVREATVAQLRPAARRPVRVA